MYYPKSEIFIRHFLSLFTFPTGRISFKAGQGMSIYWSWKKQTKSVLFTRKPIKEDIWGDSKDTLNDFQVTLVTSASFLHEDKQYNQWKTYALKLY